MTEKEKEIMKTIAAALPLMSPFEKGYFLGVAESKASEAGQLHIKKEQEEPDRILA